MRKSTPGAVAALGLSLATLVLGTAVPATAGTTAGPTARASYAGSAEEAAANKAFFEAVLKSVAEKRAASPRSAAAVTVIYNASRAPSFSAEIARSTSIWNSSVTNVKLQSGSASAADFTYREGNSSQGSYASTDGHGSGYIFLDYAQSDQYDPTRITAHETGHVLGLPDHYSGPCSELMSGGGPGTSCTNANPNAAERSRVNQLWANGLAKALR
ncbi:snapalysin [Streptomyces sp. NBC_01451]|uniref:snapalysin n=1 Tax=Streptomyces sp. NBC_01451 TaxID=2903872 RepID=UPI002E37C781|nr:snapalysin [Streptomyces sp. NBC_01451]